MKIPQIILLSIILILTSCTKFDLKPAPEQANPYANIIEPGEKWKLTATLHYTKAQAIELSHLKTGTPDTTLNAYDETVILESSVVQMDGSWEKQIIFTDGKKWFALNHFIQIGKEKAATASCRFVFTEAYDKTFSFKDIQYDNAKKVFTATQCDYWCPYSNWKIFAVTLRAEKITGAG